MKEKFIEASLTNNPKANKNVLEFIADFVYFQNDADEIIMIQFRSGYCYHFANILKTTFDRGDVCWAAPFGHIVWRDEDDIVYDIEGVYMGEAELYIPVSFLKNAINDFKRIPGIEYNASIKEINNIVEEYLKCYPEYKINCHYIPLKEEDIKEEM